MESVGCVYNRTLKSMSVMAINTFVIAYSLSSFYGIAADTQDVALDSLDIFPAPEL